MKAIVAGVASLATLAMAILTIAVIVLYLTVLEAQQAEDTASLMATVAELLARGDGNSAMAVCANASDWNTTATAMCASIFAAPAVKEAQQVAAPAAFAETGER